MPSAQDSRASTVIRAFALTLMLSAPAWAAPIQVDTSQLLVEEVVSTLEDPHAFDWNEKALQLDVGYGALNESNSFESRALQIGVAHSVGPGWLVRSAARRVTVSETASSRLLGSTPFTQAAQPSRFELLGGFAYSILEGRSMTPLSPKLTDVGHSLAILGGLQYSFFPEAFSSQLSGMEMVKYTIVAEAGLRFQIDLPHALGASVEWTYSRPLSSPNSDLPSWQRLGANLSWSFGR